MWAIVSIQTKAATLVKSNVFNLAIVGVILVNAIVLGVATYPSVVEAAGGALPLLEHAFLGVFVVELVIRIVAHGRRPQDFFRNGWNVFDFIVVGLSFIPGIAANATLLRMARLARVLRVVRFFPALRTILIGVARSLPGLAGFLALSVLTLYLYGMLGWMLFGEAYPREYGTVGRAVLTLFLLLSLETLPDAIEQGLALGTWTLLYFVSYVLIASYLLVNVLVGVVINSMEETRQAEAAERRRLEHAKREDARVEPADPQDGRPENVARKGAWIESAIPENALRAGARIARADPQDGRPENAAGEGARVIPEHAVRENARLERVIAKDAVREGAWLERAGAEDAVRKRIDDLRGALDELEAELRRFDHERQRV